jgi:hypothetical protein
MVSGEMPGRVKPNTYMKHTCPIKGAQETVLPFVFI